MAHQKPLGDTLVCNDAVFEGGRPPRRGFIAMFASRRNVKCNRFQSRQAFGPGRAGRIRSPRVEMLEDRTLLATLQFSGGLGEQSTLDSNVQAENELTGLNTPASQRFTHNDGTAVSNITLTTAASTTGNPGVNLDILSNGSVAKNGIANVSVSSGLTDASGAIGPTISVPVTIMATGPGEETGDPVTIQFAFVFNVETFASNNSIATFTYASSYIYNGKTTPLASQVDELGGSGITPIGAGPFDNETGTLHAKIGDTFTLSFSESLAGQTIAPFLGAGINNVGWLVDLNLDASVSDAPAIASISPTFTSDGGVDYGYMISSGPLPQATTVDLDWASGATLDTAIGSPISSMTTMTALGTYNLHVAAAQLIAPPPGTADLLVVVDPSNSISPGEPSKVASLGLPNIVSTDLSFNDPNGGVQFSYSIAGSDLPRGAAIELYWASSKTFDSAIGDPIYTTTTETAQGVYGPIVVPADQMGRLPEGAQYLLLVANPPSTQGEYSVVEPDYTDDIQYIDLSGGPGNQYGGITLPDVTIPISLPVTSLPGVGPINKLSDAIYLHYPSISLTFTVQPAAGAARLLKPSPTSARFRCDSSTKQPGPTSRLEQVRHRPP